MRGHHYGLEVGDRIKYDFHRTITLEGVVTNLHMWDSNGCDVKFDNGETREVVCEWCEKINTNKRRGLI